MSYVISDWRFEARRPVALGLDGDIEEMETSSFVSTPGVEPLLSYRHLDRATLEIRLLRFFANDEGDLIGSLSQARLEDSKIQYDALSYVWGSHAKSMHITIDGQTLAITRNLQKALTLLVSVTARPLWVDAICIDQTNTGERNHIVSLMHGIYR
ncbi:hypothetical protein CLAFUW4_03941 [Fulvia fulva]|uniref:Heterokaryon incompatibility domain-containing protein n=1 Tax=Passalora fulva TaxID=5499 RepID=A0A9Q8LG08_PASFU|nr:uncharacterized protein CLAFUR5_03909 [Fulvia fulva]KAK4626759.1 hypothetical protein CLAFUR4_03927 [Fulvia fulva]KAK4627667.1 hypothetical protein CLAFUR0_03928 [Fulvia fulva]UJO16941.1 hypothetical protein CLAFUR5_03909 [Fulvia fulva]WPV13502.1 hypothetical protein CLAFUW4_03941 [Fulvia fulva]WPV28915.1 hypothetical protein CLAFUW7_03930 [Fulvia fulva]